MNDKASVVKALQGSYAVFAVTNYWNEGTKEAEIRQGKNTVDAAKETGVQHFIWSSLLNVAKSMPCPVHILRHMVLRNLCLMHISSPPSS